jgi:D-alanine-D-alanine ligase
VKVLLLAGGKSGEREVSLRSGAAVGKCIESLGHEIVHGDPAAVDFNLQTKTQGIDVVFIALHGRYGEDGKLQKELEDLNVPFTGSDSKASELCFDKWQYKKLLLDHGLPVPNGELVSLHRMNAELFNQPYVLKPCDEGSSLDTHIVRTPNEHNFAISRELLDKHHEMLLEPLIVGTEITVGIFDKKALPVIEIIPPEGREFDYANKYNGLTQELCPPQHVELELQKQAQELTLKIHELTGCRHMSRTDIIIDTQNNLHVLETNTIPGLTEQSLLPKMIIEAGYTMPEFVERLLQLAIK